MAYIPINWQTGDTITAEKMNKMDNGWSVSSTQLFSETVTTSINPEIPEDPAWGTLSYSQFIDADTIVVTFNGNEYVCPKMNNAGVGSNAYGGFGTDGDFDFSDIPFAIISESESANNIATENGGTYTISASAEVVETSTEFGKARGYWKETSTPQEIFSETVVTENDGDFNYGVLSYSEEVPDGVLTVTFDGIDYTCACADATFGSMDESFEDYPFLVFWSAKSQSNAIETATEGTHTIAVSAGGGETIETSSDFSAAVNSCVETPDVSVLVINLMDGSTDKSWQEIYDAFTSGTFCIVYGYGPVLQMWYDFGTSKYYMATGAGNTSNGAFDPAIWGTAGNIPDSPLWFYKYNSQMP